VLECFYILRDRSALKTDHCTAALCERATQPEFHNCDHWFHPYTATQLGLLSHHIARVNTMNFVRDFWWVAFLSTILAKHSLANARDIIHSRTHYFQHDEPRAVSTKFSRRIEFMRKKWGDEELDANVRVGSLRANRIVAKLQRCSPHRAR